MSFLFLKTEPFDFGSIFGNVLKKWYYYVILAVFLAALILFFVKTKRPERNNLSKTQRLVYTALFAALSFVANYFTIKVSGALQISFVATVGFLSGYLLGGGLGFAASFTGDLICGIVAPFGAYNPIIGIGSGLWGLIPGVIFTYFKGNDYVKTAVSFIVSFVLCSFAVNTIGLSVMYSMTFLSLLSLLPVKLLVAAVNAALCFALVAVLPRILSKEKFNLNGSGNGGN